MNNDKDDWYYETMFGSPGKSNNVSVFISAMFQNSVLFTFGIAGPQYYMYRVVQVTDFTMHKLHLPYACLCVKGRVADNPALIAVYK